MNEQELKLYAAELECTLVMAFLPSFLNYAILDDGIIHFVISSSRFKGLTVDERTSLIFSKLKIHDPDILNKVTVVIEAFTTKQIEDLIDYYL